MNKNFFMKLIILKLKKSIIKLSEDESNIEPENVYKEAKPLIRNRIDKFVSFLLKRKSDVLGIENLEKLFALSQEGKSCLLLSDHYSNFDIPVIFFLLKKKKKKNISDKFIALASARLSQESQETSAFAQAYPRIVIYAPKALNRLKAVNMEKYKEEFGKSRSINRASMSCLREKKNSGHIIFIFPAGTRFRENDVESQKGLLEIDTYMKGFDYFATMSINGNILKISQGEMAHDIPKRDKIVIKFNQVKETKEFRNNILQENKDICEDKEKAKEIIVEKIMEEIYNTHDQLDKYKKEN